MPLMDVRTISVQETCLQNVAFSKRGRQSVLADPGVTTPRFDVQRRLAIRLRQRLRVVFHWGGTS